MKRQVLKHYFGGQETGETTSKVVCGDVSKPISVYVTNASEWWKFWEYKTGIQVNINGGGFAISSGLGEQSLSVSDGQSTFEFVNGLNKFGYTLSRDVDFGERTGGIYYHAYIRTLPFIGAGALVYYSAGAIIPL